MNGLVFADSLTVGAARRALIALFREAEFDAPAAEARHLMALTLGLSLTELTLLADRPLGEGAARLTLAAARRLAHEPLARIFGSASFRGLDLALNASTLEPRPETEILVEAALRWIREQPHFGDCEAAPRLLDLGTGSGAILIAMLQALPHARGIGSDIAPDALAIAEANARRHGVAARAEFRLSDLFERIDGTFDLILANPPYIARGDIAALMPEVRGFDPLAALDGGADGLDFYRRIAANSPRFLRKAGLLALEIGHDQGESVPALLRAAGFDEANLLVDFSYLPRVVLAPKRAGPRG